MFTYLLSLMLTLSPMTQGGNGHHWGWRNNITERPPTPTVQVGSPRYPGSTPGGAPAPTGNPNPGAYTFDN